MKKYVIGIAVSAVFLAYSVFLRHQHSEPIIAPDLSQKHTSRNTSSPASSGSQTTRSGGSNTATMAKYKDGTYTGSVANAYYGNVQVAVVISGGKLTDINFLQSPNENPNSIYVNQQADPYLKQEAIQSQSPNISLITGATFTSQAFIQSLSTALKQAKN